MSPIRQGGGEVPVGLKVNVKNTQHALKDIRNIYNKFLFPKGLMEGGGGSETCPLKVDILLFTLTLIDMPAKNVRFLKRL